MNNKKIILASGSPRRKELLSTLQIPFDVVVSNVEENFDESMSPSEVVEYLSLLKAKEVAKRSDEHNLIIGSDTVISFEDQILGKPKDEKDAKEILNTLRGKEHSVLSGVAIIDNETKEEQVVHVTAKVQMKDYSSQEVEQYIASQEPMDKAGAYAIQGKGRNLVEAYEGCYNGIVGIPICKVAALLQDFGVEIGSDTINCMLNTGERCPYLEL